jgi:hypothetical protein
MTLDRTTQLINDGYERVSTRAVALPHTIWKLTIDVEFDRPLTLAEETILGLIDAGVDEPAEIERLLGLDPGVIVPQTIVNLLRRQLLGQTDRLQLMPLGRRALGASQTRQTATYEVEARHDPYTDQFLWSYEAGEIKRDRAVRDMGLRALPIPLEIRPLDVEVRHAEIQALLDRHGLPFALRDEARRGERVQRDIVRMRATGSYQAWRQADLEVWYHSERDEWDWRLLLAGGEDRKVSETLRDLQKEGVEVLPLDEQPRAVEVGPAGHEVHRAVETARPAARILKTDEHRAALERAILEACEELIIVSPWLTTTAVDGEFQGWIERALQRAKSLQIVVGYGIERAPGRGDRKAQDQSEALRRLQHLGQTYQGRLRTVEIGNTHEKLVIVDRRHAIITSFNWLSFNPRPGRGLRRETGIRVDERQEVAKLRASLVRTLGLA